MSCHHFLPLAAALLLLPACGGSPSGDSSTNSFTVHGANGDVTMTEGAGAAPKNLPAYAPVYPGATVANAITTSAKGGGMMQLATAAPPATVLAYYKQAAAKAGLSQSMSLPGNGSGSDMMTFSQPGTQRSLNVTAGPDDNDKSKTRIDIAYGAP